MKEVSSNLRVFRRYGRILLPLAGILLLAQGAAIVCGAHWSLVFKGMWSSATFLVQLLRPDLSAFADLLKPALDSIFIALVGTIVGAVLSLFFALMAASN